MSVCGLAAAATADITGVYTVNYSVTAEDLGGPVTVNVQDLYLSADDVADVAIGVLNFNMPASAQIDYYHSLMNEGWLPTNLGGFHDREAGRIADSFITIGGVTQDTLFPEQIRAPYSTAIDTQFGGNNPAFPNPNAGWFNNNPSNGAGQVGQVNDGDGGFGLGVFIGRFAYAGDFDLTGVTLDVIWNQGTGTETSQGSFSVVPAPGSMALLGLAALAGRRRRH